MSSPPDFIRKDKIFIDPTNFNEFANDQEIEGHHKYILRLDKKSHTLQAVERGSISAWLGRKVARWTSTTYDLREITAFLKATPLHFENQSADVTDNTGSADSAVIEQLRVRVTKYNEKHKDTPIDLSRSLQGAQAAEEASGADLSTQQYQAAKDALYGTNSVAVNPQEGIRLLREIEQNYPLAQYTLAHCYEKGIGVKSNLEEAIELYQKAAEQGEANAQARLAACYEKGIGVNKDPDKALTLFRRAAGQGHPHAQYHLGQHYELRGELWAAITFYRAAATQNDSHALTRLGQMLEEGKGVEQSSRSAKDLYEKAADQGNAVAQYHLAKTYERGILNPQTYAKMIALYTQSANSGYLLAKVALARCQMLPLGLNEKDPHEGFEICKNSFKLCREVVEAQEGKQPPNISNDKWKAQLHQKAKVLFLKMANQKDSRVINLLGWWCEEASRWGGRGNSFYGKAIKYYEKAATAGNTSAMCNLARCYEEGRGVTRDPKKIAALYQQAAGVGDAFGTYCLAQCYREGRGVAQNIEKANRLEKEIGDMHGKVQ